MAPLLPPAARADLVLPAGHVCWSTPESWKTGPPKGGPPNPPSHEEPEPTVPPVVLGENSQVSQDISATQSTQQETENGSVLHEPVLDKNILHQLVGNQFKVHPTQSSQKSLEKAFGVLEQVHKLRRELNKIQLGPCEEPEVDQGKKFQNCPPQSRP